LADIESSHRQAREEWEEANRRRKNRESSLSQASVNLYLGAESLTNNPDRRLLGQSWRLLG
jgi:hypothetical protein